MASSRRVSRAILAAGLVVATMAFGAPAAIIYVEAFGADLFPTLSDRFDIVGVDPRGTGASEGAIDCDVNQETQGVYSQPFDTPLDPGVDRLVRTDRRYINACLRAADESPLPAAQGRPVDGDDVRAAAVSAIYSKSAWGALGLALAATEDGDGTLVRGLADGFYGRLDDGSTTRCSTATSSSARSSSATAATSTRTSRPATTRGAYSTTRGGTTATPSWRGGCGRSTRAARSTGRSRRPSARRRCSWWARRTTPRRPTAAACGSRATSATRAC